MGSAVFGRASGWADEARAGWAGWAGGRAASRQNKGAGCGCPHFECCRAGEPRRRGVTAHEYWDDAKAKLSRVACPEAIHCARVICSRQAGRAPDAPVSMMRRRRNVVLRPCRQVSVKNVTRAPAAISSGCAVRLTNCSTLWGELGAIGPTLLKLGYPFGSSTEVSKPCLRMIDVDGR